MLKLVRMSVVSQEVSFMSLSLSEIIWSSLFVFFVLFCFALRYVVISFDVCGLWNLEVIILCWMVRF